MASCDNQFSAALQSFMTVLTVGLTIQQSQPQLMKILCSLPILRSQAMLVVGSGKSFFILTAMWNTSKIHILDDSFMFSLRKSRWAVIKDEKIYERVTRYMLLNTMGVSRDTQLRVLKLNKAMIEMTYSSLVTEQWEKGGASWSVSSPLPIVSPSRSSPLSSAPTSKRVGSRLQVNN